MLKANVYVIELEKNGEKYYIEWADMNIVTGKLEIVCTDDIREAIKFSDLVEGKKAVAKLNSKGREVFKIKPLIENYKPVEEKTEDDEIDVEFILNAMDDKDVKETLKECIETLYEKIKDKK